jgi:hypothetical protein
MIGLRLIDFGERLGKRYKLMKRRGKRTKVRLSATALNFRKKCFSACPMGLVSLHRGSRTKGMVLRNGKDPTRM